MQHLLILCNRRISNGLNLCDIAHGLDDWGGYMARYCFNIRDDVGVILDDEGAEYSDMDAARKEARLSVNDLASGTSHTKGRRFIEISDDSGNVLEAVRFGSALH